MKYWISLIITLFPIFTFASVPDGLVKIMSIYQDRESREKVMITGYGILIEMRLLHPDKTVHQSLYMIQTVSHVSMGSYDIPTLSLPDQNGNVVPVPKLLVEIPTGNNGKIFAYHKRTQLDPGFSAIVQNQKTAPLIASSYFESFRDADLLILDLAPAQLQSLPVAAYIDLQRGVESEPEMTGNALALPEDWQWSSVGENLVFPCPKTFPRCFSDRKIEAIGTLSSPVSLNLKTDGIYPAEYDTWIPFMTDQGMSGLPVYYKEKNQISGIAGLISGSSPSSQDTWLTQFYPFELYMRWDRAVELFQRERKSYQVYGTGTFLWKYENKSLLRVAQNYNGLRFEESRETDLTVGQSQRCNHGSGFRLDNGSGFRQDNGDVGSNNCPDWSRGRTFYTQRPNQQSSPTGFLIMHHPQMTTFFPPTATGMGYFFLQNDLDVTQRNYHVPVSQRMFFELFDQSRPLIKKEEFEGFAKSIYQSSDQGKSWTADLVVTLVDKSLPQSIQLKEVSGKIKLTPRIQNDRVLKIHLDLEIQGLGHFQREIDYSNLTTQNSIMNLTQNFVEEQVDLSLIGILTHNLDYMNVQDLDMGIDRGRAIFRTSVGDEGLKSLFTIKKGSKIYYASILR